MQEQTIREFKEAKPERYLRSAIINKEASIAETYPDIPIAQHRNNILRSKGDGSSPHYWSNDKYMKRLEEYERELEQSYLGDGEFSEDFEYVRKY
jgi:hypothetical protein